MSDVISAEHFKLTPSIRSHVMKYVDKLQELIPSHGTVRVFLIEDSPRKHFIVRFKVILGKKEVLVSEEGVDLYSLITEAGDHVVKAVSQSRKRALEERRRPRTSRMAAS